MKKIIPFKKQIYFKTNVGEITSISLEHTLSPISDTTIKGDFIITGDYKMTETSVTTDPFEFNIPCEIELNENYNLDKVQINIDDFYYEVIDSKILEVNIDVLIDKLEEKDIINEISIKHSTIEEFEADLQKEDISIPEKQEEREVLEEKEVDKNMINDVQEEVKEEAVIENKEESDRCIEDEEIKPLFTSFGTTEEEYRTYKVYIVREGDSLEQITTKYQITKEELEKYNDLKEISIGDKIIIPYLYENNK